AWRTRLWVGTRGGSAHHPRQNRAALGPPRVQDALLMDLETGVSVLAHMQRQSAREGFHRWYDLRWKVVQIDHPGPSPARSCSSPRGPSCEPPTVSGHACSPVAPCPLPVTPPRGRPFDMPGGLV